MPNKSTSKSIDNPIISETLSIDSTGALDINTVQTLSNSNISIENRPTFFFFGSSSTDRAYNAGSLTAWGYIGRFLRRCAGGVIFAGASGVSGQDSAGQIARLPSVIAGLTVKPKFFVLQIAGNDILGSNALSTVKSNITSMVKMVKDAGMIPVLMTTNTLVGLTSDQIIRAACITQHMRTMYLNDPKIRLADVSRWTGDTTSISYAPITGAIAADNLHPSSYGAWLAGEALYEAVQNDVSGFTFGAAIPGILYDATNNPYGNLIANPFLNGTAGTGGAWVTSGSVPDGMTLNRTAGAGTVAISKVARTDRPGNWTRFTFTMQAGDTYSMFVRPSNTALAANTTLFGMSEIQVDTSSAGSSVQRISLRTRDAGNTQTFWDGNTPSATASDHTEPNHGSRPEFLRVPAGTFTNYAAGSLSHDLQFKGTGTLILDIGCVGLYAI